MSFRAMKGWPLARMTGADEKRQMRRKMRTSVKHISPQQKKVAAKALIEKLSGHLVNAKVVMSFVSVGNEIDTYIVDEYLKEKKITRVYPRVLAFDAPLLGIMIPRWCALDWLPEGAFGIKAPPLYWPSFDLAWVDVVLLPGLAFDESGARLGQGGGFYDRTLPLLSKAKRIGICHDVQLCANIPTEEHDLRVHRVVTDKHDLFIS